MISIKTPIIKKSDYESKLVQQMIAECGLWIDKDVPKGELDDATVGMTIIVYDMYAYLLYEWCLRIQFSYDMWSCDHVAN